MDKTEKKNPIFAPSSFLVESANAMFNNYSCLPTEISDLLKVEVFEDAELFNDHDLLYSFKKILNEFDHLTISDILGRKSELLNQFADYVKKIIMPNTYKFIANSWPPTVVNDSHSYIHYFITKLLHSTTKPENVLTWTSSCIFPQSFTRNIRHEILAVGKVKPKKKSGFWGILYNHQETDENVMTFVKLGNDGKEKSAISTKVDKFIINADNTVSIMNNEKEKANFSTEDKDHLKIWANALTENVPIPLLFTTFSQPAPKEFYAIAFNIMSRTDTILLRLLLDKSCNEPKEKSSFSLLNSFFKLYHYSRKLPSFISSVVLSDFLNFESTIDDYTKQENSNVINLCKIIFYQEECTSAIHHLCDKLVDYINKVLPDKSKTKSLPSAKITEKIVSNVIKFIYYSFDEIPYPIKLVLSIIRSHLLLRTNSRTIVYKVLSKLFFIDYLLPILEEKFDKIGIPSAFSRLFYVIFNMGQMIDEFSDLMLISKRLERHIYPRLMEFIVTISNIDSSSDNSDESNPSLNDEEYQLFETKFPTEKDIFDAINNIMTAITAQPDLFKKLYSKYTEAEQQSKSPSLLGSNYAIFISNFFVHCYDTFDPFDPNDADDDQPTEEKNIDKNQHRNPRKQFESQTIKQLTNRDVSECIDPTKPRKYYKRVIKK